MFDPLGPKCQNIQISLGTWLTSLSCPLTSLSLDVSTSSMCLQYLNRLMPKVFERARESPGVLVKRQILIQEGPARDPVSGAAGELLPTDHTWSSEAPETGAQRSHHLRVSC